MIKYMLLIILFFYVVSFYADQLGKTLCGRRRQSSNASYNTNILVGSCFGFEGGV